MAEAAAVSTISNLNIVVQQGGNAQEMQPARQSHPEQHQMAASQEQADKATQERVTVQKSGDMEQGRLNADGSGKGRYLLRQKRKRKMSEAERQLQPTGRLLDTIA